MNANRALGTSDIESYAFDVGAYTYEANNMHLLTNRRLQTSHEWDTELRELLPPPPTMCDDPLAANDGATDWCQYDCPTLSAHYFPLVGGPIRCFVFDQVTQQWPIELMSQRRDYKEWHTYLDSDPIEEDVTFAIGGPRECTNVTIETTILGASDDEEESMHTEIRCLFDGQHEYNHSVDQAHVVHVVGYATSDVHHAAGATTDFVVGTCVDTIVRIETTAVNPDGITVTINDDHFNGPWEIAVSSVEQQSTFEQIVCFYDNNYTMSIQQTVSHGSWVGTIDIIGYVNDHTIYVPVDESWIIQGGYVDGLPCILDARLESGTVQSPTNANIVLRHVRFSDEIATQRFDTANGAVSYSAPLDCQGNFCGARMGGGLAYFGGHGALLLFDNVVYDHCTSLGGGALHIDGLDADPNGVGLRVVFNRVLFWQNTVPPPGVFGGVIRLANAWPVHFQMTDVDLIDNDCIVGNVLTAWVAGFASTPLVGRSNFAVTRVHSSSENRPFLSRPFGTAASSFVIAALGPSGPPGSGVVLNCTVANSTFEKFEGKITNNPTSHFMTNRNPDLVTHYTYEDVVFRNLFTTANGDRSSRTNWFVLGEDSTAQMMRCTFESNGNRNPNEDKQGYGIVAFNARAATSVYVADSAFIAGLASVGAGLSIAGNCVAVVVHCIFKDNTARVAGGAISFVGGGSLLVQSTVFASNTVRHDNIQPEVDIIVRVYTGATGGTLATDEGCSSGQRNGCLNPVWKIDGPLPAPEDGSVMPGEIVYGNSSYKPLTLYSEVVRLPIGEHTLWTGGVINGFGIQFESWLSGGWIDIVDVLDSFTPTWVDNRPVPDASGYARDLNCADTVGGAVSANPCPLGQAFWGEERTFLVGKGDGGALFATTGLITIEDCVFESNMAWNGHDINVVETTSFYIQNSTFSPHSEDAVTVKNAAQQDCQGSWVSRCDPSQRCAFDQDSVFCYDCAPNQFGDARMCSACPPGTQPDASQTSCVTCLAGEYSRLGLCSSCPSGKTNSVDHTGCIPCESGTFRGPEQSQCEQCPTGTQPDASAASCTACVEPGTFSDDGVQCKTCEEGKVPTSSRSGCTVCPPGFQPNAQLSGCASCAVESLNAVSPDGTECVECPARMEPNSHLTDCFCKRGTYDTELLGVLKCHARGARSLEAGLDDQCVLCDKCLDCSERSITKLHHGWAFFGTGDIYQCPVADGCPQKMLYNISSTHHSTCAVGYAGPVCANCDKPHYHHLKVGNPCNPCDDGRIDVPLLLGIIFGGVAIGISIVSGVINKLDDHGIISDFRLLIGFYQILAQSSGVLNVRLPYPVPVFIDFIKLLFGEWRAVVKMDCWQLGGFYGKMWMNLAVMPIVIAGICFAIFFAQRKTLRTVIAAGAADESAMGTLRIKLIHNLFLAIFLVYPTITATLFRVPQCQMLGDDSFHEEDYTIDCSSTAYHLVLAVSILLILLIPVGVPGLFLFYMKRAKDRLGYVNTTDLGGAKLSSGDVFDEDDRYGFLISDYRPQYWYYEIVTYSRKLILGGVAVVMGRGSMAQTYFVATIEAFYLMHHMRTYPFVSHKHNVIEAIGHCSLLLLYAITLILRNGDQSQWEQEWFPKQGYGWFIVFMFTAVLPAPTVYYWYKERSADTRQSIEFGEIDAMQTDNPLAPEVEEDPDATGTAALTMPRSRLAKLQRDAKEVATSRKENKQLQQQVKKLQGEVSMLRRKSGGSAQTSISDGDDALLEPATPQPDEVEVLKKLVADESLTEETRQAAQTSLNDHLAVQLEAASVERQLSRLATEQRQVSAGLVFAEETSARAQLQVWLAKQRLRGHAATIVRVVGRDAAPDDLRLLTEEDMEELCTEMTRVEKLRFAAAVQAMHNPEHEPAASDDAHAPRGD